MDPFVDECRFAKVVTTASGDALLIAGHVIELKSQYPNWAHVISTALRRGGQEPGDIQQGKAA